MRSQVRQQDDQSLKEEGGKDIVWMLYDFWAVNKISKLRVIDNRAFNPSGWVVANRRSLRPKHVVVSLPIEPRVVSIFCFISSAYMAPTKLLIIWALELLRSLGHQRYMMRRSQLGPYGNT